MSGHTGCGSSLGLCLVKDCAPECLPDPSWPRVLPSGPGVSKLHQQLVGSLLERQTCNVSRGYAEL